MTVLLPEALPASSGWALAEYRDVVGQAVADADGVALVDTLDQLAVDEMWLIDHAVIACESATPCEVRLYSSVVSDRALLDGSTRGAFDVAEWPNGLRLAPVSQLMVQWTGATPDAQATITLQVRVLRKR